MTSGAISQHIKSLEAWAEGALFERQAKGVVLTPLGEELLPEFTLAFDRLSEAVQSIRTKSAPNKITIATLPSIAQMWLSQKLGALRQMAPDLKVSVAAVETPPNLDREPFDVSIFYQDGDVKKNQIVLLQDHIFPVCAPDGAAAIKQPEDIANQILLHDSTWAEDWATWLADTKVPVSARSGPTYSLFSFAVEEACNGAGVLIAHEALVAAKLDSGSLVVPFEPNMALPRHLVMEVASDFRTKSEFELLQDVMI